MLSNINNNFIYVVIKNFKNVDFVVTSFKEYEKAQEYANNHTTRKETYRVEVITLEK